MGPLLFFCTNQDEDEDIENDLYSDLPRWSASLEKDRVKGRIGSKPARQIGYKGSDNVEWGKGGVDAKVGDYSLAHEQYVIAWARLIVWHNELHENLDAIFKESS